MKDINVGNFLEEINEIIDSFFNSDRRSTYENQDYLNEDLRDLKLTIENYYKRKKGKQEGGK